jgi:hypothetical protein
MLGRSTNWVATLEDDSSSATLRIWADLMEEDGFTEAAEGLRWLADNDKRPTQAGATWSWSRFPDTSEPDSLPRVVLRYIWHEGAQVNGARVSSSMHNALLVAALAFSATRNSNEPQLSESAMRVLKQYQARRYPQFGIPIPPEVSLAQIELLEAGLIERDYWQNFTLTASGRRW